MIDRDARNKLCEAIAAYTGETIAAFEFDERIFDIADGTEDKTVKEVVTWLWFHYDDNKDHKIVATKEEWDWFQRLQLMLESDAELRISRKWRWTVRQVIAIPALLLFVKIALVVGYGLHLFIVAIPFGLVSLAISETWWGPKPDQLEDPKLTPFSSYTDLIRTRREVYWFTKYRYPKRIESRTIRGQWLNSVMMMNTIVIWLLFAPVALFFQSLPRHDVSAQILTPSAAATS